MSRIAYLAPEIPALSATFVYNEIIALQAKGYSIVPISVHVPFATVSEERLAELKRATHYLYQEGLISVLLAATFLFVSAPFTYCRTLLSVFHDAFQVGVCNRCGLGLFYRFLVACRAACILKQEKCHHLHAHFAHGPTDIAMYAAALAGIPFSFTTHANDLFERGYLLSEKMARCKFAVTISEFNRKFMTTHGGEKKKIHIVRCGVDSTRFSPAPPRSLSLPYKIGSIGRMVEKKGFHTLIQAAALLQESGIDFRLTIAGGGPIEGELHQAVERLGLSGSIDFPGPMPNENVPSWLQSMDLFVLPCQMDTNGDMDGIPVALMEAMLSGVPVVSTRISGIPELISDGKDGVLVEPESPVTLASAITKLLFDNELRNSLRRNALKKIKGEFDIELNVQRLITLFDN